jgi:hypothetical protein
MANLLVDNKNKKLSQLTKLEAEKESQRRAFDEQEQIEAMGQVSDLKSRYDVRRYFKLLEDEENGFRDEAYEILLSLRKDRLKYNHFLEAVLARFVSQEDLPKSFQIKIKSNSKGLVIFLMGTKYYKAVGSCGIPPYDYHACKIMAVQLGNTVAKLSGSVRQTEAGIILPDSEDLKLYTNG